MADPLLSAWLTLKGVEDDIERSKWLQGLVDEMRGQVESERPAKRAAERLRSHAEEKAKKDEEKRLRGLSDWATEEWGDDKAYAREMLEKYPESYEEWVHDVHGGVDPLAEEVAEEDPFGQYAGFAEDDDEPLSLLGGGANQGVRFDPVTGEYVDDDDDDDGEISPLEEGASISEALNHPRTKLPQGFITEERWNPDTGEYEEVQIPRSAASSGKVAAQKGAAKAQGKGAKRYKAKDWGEAALAAQHGFAQMLSIIDGGREEMPRGRTMPFLPGEAGQALTPFAPPAFPAPPGMVKVGVPSGSLRDKSKGPYTRIIPSSTFEEVDPRQLNWPPEPEDGDV